ncbi:MAG: START-like domain-containing protein [Flavobacteriaceae bacterium]|nr:START-like domain-containing protein [Flavobacteriaceae bacterium]
MSKKTFFSVEYDFHASPQLLFQYLSTPSGLSEWFADNVNSRGEIFDFIWDDSEEQAKLIQKKTNERIRFQWVNGESDQTDYYFEFKIEVDEITKDVSLVISDYADDDEVDESKLLWDNLVADLKQVLGSS